MSPGFNWDGWSNSRTRLVRDLITRASTLTGLRPRSMRRLNSFNGSKVHSISFPEVWELFDDLG